MDEGPEGTRLGAAPPAWTRASWGVLALGLLVIVGWLLDVSALKSLLPGAVSMKPNTALGFSLLGAALLLSKGEGRTPQVASAVAAVAVLALGVITLGQDLLGVDAGIDQVLFQDDTASNETGNPGRMAPSTAVGLALTAAAILLVRSAPAAAQSLCALTMGLAAIGLLGHLYGAQSLYRVASLTAMAFHTGVGLLLAAAAALFLRPDRGLAAALLDRSPAGDELRRLVPAAILTPIAVGALGLAGKRLDLWSPEFEAALVAIIMVIVLLGLSYLSYKSLRRSQGERLQAVSSLATSEERYRRTFENATIGMAHLAHDGRWIRVNQRLCEIFGYEPEELLGKTYTEVSHLDDLELDVKQWELLRRGEISDYGVERRFLSKEGENVFADVRLVRETDEAGNLLYFTAVVQDITGRKLSEGTLRVYERALAATQNGIVITDAVEDDNPIAYANTAFLEITGYDSAEVIGKNCRFLNAEARDQTALDEIRRAIRRGQDCSVLLRNHRKDGQAFWNQLAIAPVKDPDGKLTHFVGVIVDATERMHAASEREELLHSAEAANRSKDRFLSVVSHELRSPLNAILAWTSILREHGGDGDVLRAVEAIESSVRGQTRLVDDLLDASRIREGTLEIEIASVNVSSLVEESVQQAIPLAKERGVDLHLDQPDDTLFAMLDPERVGQILRNLIGNALKFTPEGGRVEVELSAGDDTLEVAVRDTGKGIPEADLPNVFDEFWQAERKGSSGGKGLGLGLAIVKHLVERQGGTVGVESDGLDRGAVFRVRFPRSAAAPPSAQDDARPASPHEPRVEHAGGSAPVEESAETPELDGIEVLVVDDDDATVEAFSGAFRRAGALVHEANSVAEALRHLERTTPEVLVSDIGLPNRDGLSLIRSVRKMDEPRRSILAMAVTGLADRAERRRILRAGYDAYLAKPVEPPVVVNRVANLLRLDLENPLSRKVMVVGSRSGDTDGLVERLRAIGQAVHFSPVPSRAVSEAAGVRPDLVIASLPLDGMSPESLAERLLAKDLAAPLIGVLDPDDDADQKPFHFVLWRPLDEVALRRILLFGGEPV